MLGTSRRLLTGASVFLGALVVVALFAVAFHGRSGSSRTSATIATSTSTPSPTIGPLNLATLPTTDQAWGSQTGKTEYAVPQGFHVQNLSADGTRIFGYRISADGQTFADGWVTLATNTPTLIHTSPVTGPIAAKRANSTQCCSTDGRYIVGIDRNVDLAAGTLWSYDTQSGKTRTITTTNLDFLAWVVNGQAIYAELDSEHSLFKQADLGSGQVADVAHQLPATAGVGHTYSYPYVTYRLLVNNIGAIHLLNLQTGQDTDITRYGNFIDTASLSDDTAFYIDPDTTIKVNLLQEADHLTSSTKLPTTLAYLPKGNVTLAGNDRVVALALAIDCPNIVGGCQYNIIWDRTLHKMLLLSQDLGNFALNGHYLAFVDNANKLTLYDTAKLPSASPGG